MAARKSPAEKEKNEARPPSLPLPAPVLHHHGRTLFGPMVEWRTRGHVPPVLLLTGLDGVGKRSVGQWLAQWILCRESGFARPEESTASLFGEVSAPAPPPEGDPRPCGQCTSCSRALSGSWLDFAEILPEEDSETLKIDQFRELKAKLGFGAHEGPLKITMIPDADRMTPQAANSMLKLLEEPPPGWAFFLTASDPSLVLPTVLSRCQVLRLKPFDPPTLRELLGGSGLEPARLEICAELAQGSWGKALKLATAETWERRGDLLAFLEAPGSTLGALVDWATSEPRHLESLLDQLESLLADLVRASVSGAPQWANRDGATALAAQTRRMHGRFGSPAGARAFWTERAERLTRIRRESLAPLNRKLLVQDLLMPFL